MREGGEGRRLGREGGRWREGGKEGGRSDCYTYSNTPLHGLPYMVMPMTF